MDTKLVWTLIIYCNCMIYDRLGIEPFLWYLQEGNTPQGGSHGVKISEPQKKTSFFRCTLLWDLCHWLPAGLTQMDCALSEHFLSLPCLTHPHPVPPRNLGISPGTTPYFFSPAVCANVLVTSRWVMFNAASFKQTLFSSSFLCDGQSLCSEQQQRSYHSISSSLTSNRKWSLSF